MQQTWRTFLFLRNAWLRFKWWQENREACLLSDDGNEELKNLQMMNWIEDSLNQMQNTKKCNHLICTSAIHGHYFVSDFNLIVHTYIWIINWQSCTKKNKTNIQLILN